MVDGWLMDHGSMINAKDPMLIHHQPLAIQ